MEEIIWDDAYHIEDGWSTLEEISETYKQKRFRIVNVGWVIYEDKKYVILGAKHSEDWKSWGLVMMIPKGIIVKRKRLKTK